MVPWCGSSGSSKTPDPERVEEADDREAHLGPQLIDVAGNEQADLHRAPGLQSRRPGRATLRRSEDMLRAPR